MNQTVSIKVNENTKKEMQSFYKNYMVNNNGQYILFMAKKNNVVITFYTSNNVVFQGNNSLREAKTWDKTAKIKKNNTSIKKQGWLYLDEQIGSDEVGVGDYLLPMIVCAALVKKSDIKFLKELGVNDSKKLTDSKIEEIAKQILGKFELSKITLSNEKYNKLISEGDNINSIKAKMHNKAIYLLCEKSPNTKKIFLDQFVNEKKYFEYLKDCKNLVKNITFKTKGETYFPSIALGSIMARFALLQEKRKLESKYNVTIPFGAGENVDKFSNEFIKKFGEMEFKKIAKLNFANTKKIDTLV